MKNQIKIQILTLTATLVMASQVHAGCPLRQDVIASTKALSQYLKENRGTPGIVKVSLESKESPTFQLDRDNADFPEYKALEGDGTIASRKGISIEKIKNGAAFARVVAITKCHSLTNLHVVDALAKEQGQKEVSSQTTVYASYGQGKSCDGSASFKEPDRLGKVVGFNPNAYFRDPETNETKIYDHLDYAVVAHSEPLRIVEPVNVNRFGLSVGDRAIRVGQSIYDLEKGLQYAPVDIVLGSSASTNGITAITNQKAYHGRSGGGIYKEAEQGKWEAAAIYVGGGHVLNIASILKDIRLNNPALYQDIVRVKNGGACLSM